MLRAVLIDVDNTLLDFHAGARDSMRRAFADTALPYDDGMFVTFTAVNDRLWREIETGERTRERLYAERFDLVLAALGMTGDGPAVEARFRHYLSHSAIPVEGALDLLRDLAGRFTVTVASNGPYQQQLDRLAAAGMAPYIDHYFISEEVGAQKPQKAFFDVCFARLGDPRPDEVVMIGDSLTADIAGAADCGMRTCWYNHDRRPVPADCPADTVATRLADIPPLL